MLNEVNSTLSISKVQNIRVLPTYKRTVVYREGLEMNSNTHVLN